MIKTVEERKAAARAALQEAVTTLSELETEYCQLQHELAQLEGAIDEVLAEQAPLQRTISAAKAELADIDRIQSRQLSLFGDV